MNRTPQRTAALFAFCLTLGLSDTRAHALTADLGSNGSYGPINITADTTLPLPADGVFHATTVTIAANATLRFSYTGIAHPGVIILATGDVTINGTLDVSGDDSTATTAGRGGPGGSSGGAPSTFQSKATMLYPAQIFPPVGGQEVGYRPFGGRGGSSAGRSQQCTTPGAGGGGGGGSLLILSNTRVIGTGTIDARGGGVDPTTPSGNCAGTPNLAGAGVDGNIRIVAPTVALSTANVRSAALRIDAITSTGSPTLQRGPLGGVVNYTTGGVLARMSPLPMATITAINGTVVAPSSAIQIPSTTTNPWTIRVRVTGCTAPSVRATISAMNTGTESVQATSSSVLANPSGDDLVDVSINTTGSPTNSNYNSFLLFPGALCGLASSP